MDQELVPKTNPPQQKTREKEARPPDADLIYTAETDPETAAAYAGWRLDRAETAR